MSDRLQRISRFLSRVLRHRPDAIGLQLDDAGWADVEQLLRSAARHGMPMTREELLAVVAGNDKQRFALDAAARRIRANQGHSVAIDLKLPPCEPPEHLFHGTATRFLSSIRVQGLLPGTRRHVHLSALAATAREVGARHGTPVVLEVQAQRMHRDGCSFMLAANGVWLTSAVPAVYIRFPDAAE